MVCVSFGVFVLANSLWASTFAVSNPISSSLLRRSANVLKLKLILFWRYSDAVLRFRQQTSL